MSKARAHDAETWHVRDIVGLLLVIFVDGLGTALVLPLMPALLAPENPASLVFARGYSPAGLAFLYGAILASYAGAMTIGAPILGQLSDRIGRRRALLVATVGAFAGYVLCAGAMLAQSAPLFIVARLIGGLFAGSVPIAQARLLDLPGRSMTGIGIVMFAITSGFLFGPLIAGAALSVAAPAGEPTLAIVIRPFLIAAVLSGLCILLVARLPEDSSGAAPRAGYGGALGTLRAAVAGFAAPGPRPALVALLFFQFGWNLFYQYLPWILTAAGRTANFVTWTMAVVGLGLCLSFCWVAGRLQGRLPEVRIAVLANGLLILVVAVFPAILEGRGLTLAASLVAAVLYGCGYTALVAIAVAHEEPDHLGRVLGTVASIAAATAGVTALTGGALALLDLRWLVATAAAAFAVSLLVVGRPR